MIPSDMKIARVPASDAELLDVESGRWARIEAHEVALGPAPVALAVAVSPYLARSVEHGRVKSLRAQVVHNGTVLCVRLVWEDPTLDDRIADLDRFVDAAAVMFPLADGAESLTMGDAAKPVNAWLWRADRAEPFDVIARGFSTSERRAGSTSGLVARGRHANGGWTVVFQRPLDARGPEYVGFKPGTVTGLSYAVWDGSNAERAGQKAISGGFVAAELET